jgi:RNA polymerase sigma-70 factor (ECF subfamily)
MTKIKKDQIFEELYRSKFKAVVGYCYNYVHDPVIALDLAQEIFINAYTHLNDFKGKSKLSTWLYSIARNYCSNYRRYTRSSKRRGITMSIDELQGIAQGSSKYGEVGLWAYKYLHDKSAVDALENMVSEEKMEKINRIVSDLPEVYARTLTTIYNDGDQLSYADAAKILKVSQHTVRSRLNRSRKEARRKLAIREKIGKI